MTSSPDVSTDHDLASCLAGILASPDDDLPRLAYADRLEELGDPASLLRAEFIRLELALTLPKGGRCNVCLEAEQKVKTADWDRRQPFARTCYCKGDRGLQQYRAQELLSLHGEEWMGYPLNQLSDEATCLFHRGFVGQVNCRLDDWFQHGKALIHQHPLVRVGLTDRKPRRLESKRYAWCLGSWESDRLPVMLYSLLPDPPADEAVPGTIVPTTRTYRDLEAANAALSVALLRHARERQGDNHA